jgi:hypothetical protein
MDPNHAIFQGQFSGFIPKVNVDQGNTLQIISGGGKLFLVEEHIR